MFYRLIRLPTVFLVLLAAFLLPLTSGLATEVKVNITHPESTGPIRYAVFDSEETFPEAGMQIYSEIVPIPEGSTQSQIVFDVPPSVYAVAMYLDQDQSEALTYNFIGLPKEPIGWVKAKSGRPDWEQSRFIVADTPLQFTTTIEFLF